MATVAAPQTSSDFKSVEREGMGECCGREYDIIGSLPLDLLLEIVGYLEPADIVRSRRASKRWQSIFSSDTITTFLLRRTLAFLNIDGANVAASDAVTYFRWQHGLQCARPVKKIFLPWSQTLRMQKVAYHS
ncbi:hypothetical protein VTN49DRAFT_2716 [Thermomyces lanuginosus]|uniref:uncharacterized protein n=1 Tax=Thermomyces lanuginosus TaxID=5541 RepID=UPI0037438018